MFLCFCDLHLDLEPMTMNSTRRFSRRTCIPKIKFLGRGFHKFYLVAFVGGIKHNIVAPRADTQLKVDLHIHVSFFLLSKSLVKTALLCAPDISTTDNANITQ